jgi:hypothetical protein
VLVVLGGFIRDPSATRRRLLRVVEAETLKAGSDGTALKTGLGT